MQPEQKFNEYYDALMTVELAMGMACKYDEPVDKPIAQCARLVAMRCKDLSNRKLFIGVSKSECPGVMISMMRITFDEIVSS